MPLKISILFGFLFFVSFSIQDSSAVDCASFLANQTVSYLAAYNGIVSAGTAYYSSNGSFITWDPSGNMINQGFYKIWENNGWCYELETYTYPSDGFDTCNTFQICQESNSMIGCEIFGDECYETCETESEWTNWYAARIVPSPTSR